MKPAEIPEPNISRFFFADTRFAWLWPIARIAVGYAWLHAGWAKLQNPAWTGSQAGKAVSSFLAAALEKTSGQHPDVSRAYGYFIENFAGQHPTLFSYLITYGEIAIGIALVLGAFTGIAAFFGAFLNMNFLLAGTVSANPLLLLLELLLILAWRNAGWIGLDRWLLPWLGVPWQPGTAFKDRKTTIKA